MSKVKTKYKSPYSKKSRKQIIKTHPIELSGRVKSEPIDGSWLLEINGYTGRGNVTDIMPYVNQEAVVVTGENGDIFVTKKEFGLIEDAFKEIIGKQAKPYQI